MLNFSMPEKAILLLSGGLDSTTMLALAKRDGFSVHALTIAYRQRHAVEIDAARAAAKQYGIEDHRILEIDLRAFGGSALTDDIPVPKDSVATDSIPITYVPARN